MLGKFPKLCLDEKTKKDIGVLWICAYTECGRGHPDRELTIKEECANFCNKPVDKEPATKDSKKRPAEKDNNPNPDKKKRKTARKIKRQ